MPALRTALAFLAFTCCASASTLADPLLADFPYPYPVQNHALRSQGQPLSMAYMDVHPTQPNGRTIVLLHGFIKKTQKTPPGEIDTALKRWKEMTS